MLFKNLIFLDFLSVKIVTGIDVKRGTDGQGMQYTLRICKIPNHDISTLSLSFMHCFVSYSMLKKKLTIKEIASKIGRARMAFKNYGIRQQGWEKDASTTHEEDSI